MNDITEFEEGLAYTPISENKAETLQITLDGFEGPLSVLLDLARSQKVDLAQISILQLAEQYIAFIQEAEDLKLEIAADYLVMASWLAYLKSRLLLPQEEDEEEPTAEELAARLRFRLQRLEAMRECLSQLMNRDLLGRNVFAHGMPEGVRIKRHTLYQANLYELLTSYSSHRLQHYHENWTPPKLNVVTLTRARMRLERMLGKINDWDHLDELLLAGNIPKGRRRTLLASGFAATLEYIKDGRLEVRQEKNFDKIAIRRARPKSHQPYSE